MLFEVSFELVNDVAIYIATTICQWHGASPMSMGLGSTDTAKRAACT